VSTFLLIPGAGGAAWYWHRISPLLRAAGHTVIAVDLPGADPTRGLPEYADLVATAGGGRHELVVVAQSMGAFSALPACDRLPVRALVLLNAMVPAPGETPGDWWEHTGWAAARVAAARAGGYPEAFDLETYFLHDVDLAVAAAGESHQRPEADIAFEQPCAFERWPDVPTTVLAGRGDRFFPLDFQRRVARERLGAEVHTLPGGHLAALSEPQAVAGALAALTWREQVPRPPGAVILDSRRCDG
jgi:pimeloyl-ACP methyl ester carboxylesterase